MDIETFMRTVPSSRRQQSERMQIAGFVQGFGQRLGIEDIAACRPDPPDFILTTATGMRIGIEVKRLRFAMSGGAEAIRDFRAACRQEGMMGRMYEWRPTSLRTILAHLQSQLDEAVGRSAAARRNHPVDQLWLFFFAATGNPVARVVESLSYYNASEPNRLHDAFCVFMREVSILCQAVPEFDAILLSGGLFAFAAKNTSAFPCFSIPQAVMERGHSADLALLDCPLVRSTTWASKSGLLEWS